MLDKAQPSAMGISDVNFDGLVGPTHNYGGLAGDNLAATRNKDLVANPREAALQGLAKMKALADAGYAQAVLPPHERPDVDALRAVGFSGSDRDVLAAAARAAPDLLTACSSAAAMWTANAATVSPSADTSDARVHITPANLVAYFHRALEAATTTRVLRSIFADSEHFVVHDPLPADRQFGDEGAANHMRFAAAPDAPGIEVFVYGRDAFAATGNVGRQTRQACEAIARRHKLTASRTLFLQQSPDAIAAGVFHNDVIAVASGAILFCHQRAFVDQAAQIAQLRACVGPTFTPLVVADADIALEQAVSTYVFNSQLLARHDGRVLMVAPLECATDPCVAAYLARLTRDGGPIAEVRTFDLRQSMRNGGGPACLRLCVRMTAKERAAVAGKVWLDQAMYDVLHGWVQRHYRDRLAQQDLADPSLLDESRRALDELSRLLRLGNIYAFQRVLQ